MCMKEIETISDLAMCTDISLLQEQRKVYTDTMDAYCARYPLFAFIKNQMTADKDFGQFMALYVASSTLTARINELEGKTND